jgi:hypothetical protein
MYDVDSPETMPDTPGPSKMKKDDEVQDVHRISMKTLISREQGDDGGGLGGSKVEKNKGEVTPPREEEDPFKKRKLTPPKPSSRKKAKATRTTFKTTLIPDEFNFLVAVLNDASLEIVERQEVKQEEVFIRFKGEVQEVQQKLQSSRAFSITQP